MSNVISLEDKKDDVQYAVDENGKIAGVTHPKWNFIICRDKEGKKTAFVCDNADTEEIFGELDSEMFNQVLLAWLLIDQPDLVDSVSEKQK